MNKGNAEDLFRVAWLTGGPIIFIASETFIEWINVFCRKCNCDGLGTVVTLFMTKYRTVIF